MSLRLIFSSLFLLFQISFSSVNIIQYDDSPIPEQIHLSLGDDPTSMVLVWATPSHSTKSTVKFGLDSKNLDKSQDGWEDSYTTTYYSSPLFHYVVLVDLQPNTRYYYQVGDVSSNSWSLVYSFKTPSNQKTPVTIGCIGDVGQTDHSVETLNGLLGETDSELVILVGDLSYADGVQPEWDRWGNLVQNFTVSIPWMFLPGNHENEPRFRFISYEHRILMTPGLSSPSKSDNVSGGGNFYYSFDYSYVHFVMLSSETNYSTSSDQYFWLEYDLQNVDRSKTPWIVVSWHRPWYSSNSHHQGEGEKMRNSMENLLYKYGVDFCLNGHVHAYERTERMYNFQIDPYGPYYFTIGDGGNREGLATPWLDPQPEWSAFRYAAYGYTTFHVYNETHIHWVMYQDDGFTQEDELWILKP